MQKKVKLDKKFNNLTYDEYISVINNHKSYENFNTLGLYRSIIETKLLNDEQKIQVRDLANEHFGKTFEFLQLKDIATYLKLVKLGQTFTEGDERKLLDDIIRNQQRILKDKRIKHRNFGTYSKHLCGNDWCPYNGMMIKQGSELAYGSMHFDSDHRKFTTKNKSERLKKEMMQFKNILNKGKYKDE